MTAEMSGSPAETGPWHPLAGGGPFTALIGPIYRSAGALEQGERVRLGLRIREDHCNPRLVCHGGMLATFLDVVLAYALREYSEATGPLPTISMTLDYLAAVPCGSWIESRAQVQRLGGAIGFASALIVGPDGLVLRGSGTFRRFRPRDLA